MPAPAGGRGGVEIDGLSAAQPEALRHLVWLNEASAKVGTTLDLQRTAKEFADFTVPRLADGCAVDLLESVLRGEEGTRWSASRPPVLRAMAVTQIEQLGDLEPDAVGEIATSDPTLVGMQCLMAREPILISRIGPDEYERIAVTRSAAAEMRKAGVHSYMVIPLIARGVLLGLADFVRSAGHPPFTRTDLALAVQLASKAAVFVDNARLYGRERDHVVTLLDQPAGERAAQQPAPPGQEHPRQVRPGAAAPSARDRRARGSRRPRRS
jgi:GAF domain-containing protein